jgi:predicted metal-binding protein
MIPPKDDPSKTAPDGDRLDDTPGGDRLKDAPDGAMREPDVTVFVCVTCKAAGKETAADDAKAAANGDPPPGRRLFEAVTARTSGAAANVIAVTPVECLAVCRRPCTIALSAPGKWTCVVGDLDPLQHADDVIAAALSHAASGTGIIPWRQRPLSFRKGVIARIPPLGFRPAAPGD